MPTQRRCCRGTASLTGQRVFDVKLQGSAVLENFDIVRAAGGADTAVVKEFRGVRASDRLQIEFVPRTTPSDQRTAPLVSSIEVLKSTPEPR